MDDADEIAVEHLLWASEHGQSVADVLASVGVDWPRQIRTEAHDALRALASRWRQISTNAPHRPAVTRSEANGNKRTNVHSVRVTGRDGPDAKALKSTERLKPAGHRSAA